MGKIETELADMVGYRKQVEAEVSVLRARQDQQDMFNRGIASFMAELQMALARIERKLDELHSSTSATVPATPSSIVGALRQSFGAIVAEAANVVSEQQRWSAMRLIGFVRSFRAPGRLGGVLAGSPPGWAARWERWPLVFL